jgi:hypothetical protein
VPQDGPLQEELFRTLLRTSDWENKGAEARGSMTAVTSAAVGGYMMRRNKTLGSTLARSAVGGTDGGGNSAQRYQGMRWLLSVADAAAGAGSTIDWVVDSGATNHILRLHPPQQRTSRRPS